MRYHKTQFDDGEQRLLYGEFCGIWRFYHQVGNEEPRAVGAQYPTKATLLADCARYGAEWGF